MDVSELIKIFGVVIALVIASFTWSSATYADALDEAILQRAKKEHAQDLKYGVAGQANHAAAGSKNALPDQNKLSAEEKAVAAISGLAKSVAASNLTQHSITHSSSSVAQLPKQTGH